MSFPNSRRIQTPIEFSYIAINYHFSGIDLFSKNVNTDIQLLRNHLLYDDRRKSDLINFD